MNTESDVDVVISQELYELGEWILSLSDGKTVSWYDDNILGGCKDLTDLLDGCFGVSSLNLSLLSAEFCVTTEDDVLKRSVHSSAHNVRKNGTR